MPLQENCENIIQDMCANLPDNPDQIPEFLNEHIVKYVTHPCSREVIRKIASLAVESLSPQEFTGFISLTDYPEQMVRAVLEATVIFLQNKNLQHAENLMQYLLPFAEKKLEDNEEISFLSFRDFIEYAYYMTYLTPESELSVHPYTGTEILFIQGKICLERGDNKTALRIFDFLSRISPVNDSILFELAEIHRGMGNLETFREMTNQCFQFAWKPDELAHAYRNMGYFLTESGDYEGAITCYLMSTTWEDTSDVKREITYITEKSGITPDMQYYITYGQDILKKRNVPFGPNKEFIQLMLEYANECKDEGDFFEARKYLSRAKALELSDSIERQIEVIERFIEDNTIF